MSGGDTGGDRVLRPVDELPVLIETDPLQPHGKDYTAPALSVEQWWVITIFCLVSFLLGFTWQALDMLPAVSMQLFWNADGSFWDHQLPIADLTNEGLTWMLVLYNSMQALAVPLSIYLLFPPSNEPGFESLCPPRSKTGLRTTVLLAATCLLLQNALWAFAATHSAREYEKRVTEHPFPFDTAALYVGVCFAGIGGQLVMGCVSRFSVVWFPPQQRVLVTGITFSAQYAGLCASYIASLFICTAINLKSLIIAQLALSIFAFFAAFTIPDSPLSFSSHPSATTPRFDESGATGPTVVSGALSMFAGPCLPIMFASAGVGGVYSGWQSVVQLMWDTTSTPGMRCKASSTMWERVTSGSKDGVLLGLLSMVAYALGSGTIGAVADKWFQGHLKPLLSYCFAGLIACFAVITSLMMPSSLLIDTSHKDAPALSSSLVLKVAVCLSGLFGGAGMPVSLELLAEVAHPIPEGTSANVALLIFQLANALAAYLVEVFSPAAMSLLVLVLTSFGIIAVCCVRVSYRRSEAA